MLELSQQEFKTTIIIILIRVLMNKIAGMQEEMGKNQRYGKTKNQKGRLDIKNTATVMKNALVGLLTDYTQPRKKKMSVLETISIETSKTERQITTKTERKKKKNKISKDCGENTKYVPWASWDFQKEKKDKKKQEKYLK